jgi:AcrR family transcriptional regulator
VNQVNAGRKQEILAAAEKLFHERRFDATGIDAIAEEAGITGGAIYRHFGGKNEILAVLLDQAIDAVVVESAWRPTTRSVIFGISSSGVCTGLNDRSVRCQYGA